MRNKKWYYIGGVWHTLPTTGGLIDLGSSTMIARDESVFEMRAINNASRPVVIQVAIANNDSRLKFQYLCNDAQDYSILNNSEFGQGYVILVRVPSGTPNAMSSGAIKTIVSWDAIPTVGSEEINPITTITRMEEPTGINWTACP